MRSTDLPREVGLKKTFPQFLTWDYFTEDPAAAANFLMAGLTVLLLWTAIRTGWRAEEASNKALEATHQQIITLIKTERAYITGGGGFGKKPVVRMNQHGVQEIIGVTDPSTFSVDVANYGKTPALLTHFDIQFRTRAQVEAEWIEPQRTYRHFDWIDTGHDQLKTIKPIPIPPASEVVFGCFWYRDFERNEHYFRFILRIGQFTTHSDIADEVDERYTHWT